MTGGKSRDKTDSARRDAAEALAIAALAFLASDPEYLGRFLATTGIGPDQIRNAARDRGFLSGVLDHFSADEKLLVAFAKHSEIDPSEIERARQALGGAWQRDPP